MAREGRLLHHPGPRSDGAPPDHELFTLNDTGKATWDKLDGQCSLADVVATLHPELEEAEDGAGERDVLGPVAELVARRLPVAA